LLLLGGGGGMDTWIDDAGERGAEENIWTGKEVTGGWRKMRNAELRVLLGECGTCDTGEKECLQNFSGEARKGVTTS
jgi:hypothetical protein